ISSALGHLHRFAIAQQTDHLHQLHIERHLVMGQRPDRRLDTFYRAGVIGAPYVDKLISALRLLVMIGQIRAEIGPTSVRFLDRAVLIVAKLGGAKERQLDWLPILRR